MSKSDILRKRLMRIRLHSWGIGLVAALLVGCTNPDLPHDLNKRAVDRIKVMDVSDFTFAVIGDNKGNSSVFEPLLRGMGEDRDIAFVIDNGDLVDGGTKRHYAKLTTQIDKNLKIPFLAVIGNHDLDKGSAATYREVFGPTCFSFNVGPNAFIAVEAASEAGMKTDALDLLKEELKKEQTATTRFVFMHVPPIDPRMGTENKCLRNGKDVLKVLKQYNVTYLFASHIHGYFEGVVDGVPCIITGGAGAKLQGNDSKNFFHHFVRIHVSDRGVEASVKRFDSK